MDRMKGCALALVAIGGALLLEMVFRALRLLFIG